MDFNLLGQRHDEGRLLHLQRLAAQRARRRHDEAAGGAGAVGEPVHVVRVGRPGDARPPVPTRRRLAAHLHRGAAAPALAPLVRVRRHREVLLRGEAPPVRGQPEQVGQLHPGEEAQLDADVGHRRGEVAEHRVRHRRRLTGRVDARAAPLGDFHVPATEPRHAGGVDRRHRLALRPVLRVEVCRIGVHDAHGVADVRDVERDVGVGPHLGQREDAVGRHLGAVRVVQRRPERAVGVAPLPPEVPANLLRQGGERVPDVLALHLKDVDVPPR
ncbi:unannotated protein [freshwater metagenome]|uniref:Unannotated protein n=1 Tax=freshwater metagenome TaxID=449393 RepID=A0A6J7IAP1_9ZZZZ